MPALTLEAGKFYRTAAGQKVGPLVPQAPSAYDDAGAIMGAKLDGQDRLWRKHNGQHLFNEPGIEIVSEWSDEQPDLFALTRLADAAEKIAAALEAIEKHLAPVITGTPETDGPLRIGEHVFDKESVGKDRGRIIAIRDDDVMIQWDNMAEPGNTWWPIADFERVTE